MNSRCRVFIATSLDGMIARPDGNLDWLDQAAATTNNNDCGYHNFYATTDALIMGRGTFEKVLSFPEWPYEDKPVVVMSRQPYSIPSRLPSSVRSTQATPTQLVQELSEEGLHTLYIDGGKTIQSFLRAGLIEELIITTIPILIGSGIRLFDGLTNDIHLKLISSHSYPFGFVQSQYEVLKQDRDDLMN